MFNKVQILRPRSNMKTLRHFLVFLALTFTAIAHAVTEDVTVSTTGYGDSYQKAVATALLEAVSQVRGVNIATDKTLKSDFEAYATDNAAYAKSQTQVVQDISVQTKGQVKSYQITSTKEPGAEGGQWEVQAQVVVPSYKAMGKEDKRFSIAVMPFHSKSGKSVVAGKLRDDILNTLTQSRKFNVVSRDFENEFAAEKDLLQSDDVSANEASRLGQVSGADLMVVGTIYDASVSTKTTVTPTETTNFYGMSVTEGGQVHTSSKSSVKLNYRVIEVATQKVKWANTWSANSGGAVADSLLEQGAKTIVSDMLEVIYPVKVLKVSGDKRIILNEGDARLQMNMVLDAYSAGESFLDPDTGAEIVTDGTVVAQLKVIESKPKYSIAELVSGDISQIKEGGIVRMQKPKATEKPAEKPKKKSKSASVKSNAPVRSPTDAGGEAPVNWQ